MVKLDKQTQTFFGIIGIVFGIAIFASNQWDFKSIPSLASAIGLLLFIGGLWAVYDANR
ncbi:MAG TPA: hypothetical protein HA224_04540 [Nanoarchaeota archaeon]|nr:hypothetical protein [Nanoarchaeota archaeon]